MVRNNTVWSSETFCKEWYKQSVWKYSFSRISTAALFKYATSEFQNPHFQNEARCTTFLLKMSFIYMRMKNDFHIKGWAPTLVLKQRPGGTRKWPICLKCDTDLRAAFIWRLDATKNRPFPHSCKQRTRGEGGQNTVFCMKLSTRPSASFLYVCSLERNAGKVYWINYDTIISRIELTELTSSDLNYIRATVDCEQLVRGEHARLVPTVTRVFIFVSRASRLTD